ncbi:unnamed protein product [Paramecium sonneborni]|uniref:Uncharacterized protein n=1 Tax=Paramecium sonneborni TaxID=65129 RepID=A0A8S1RTA6_9CILI|nr:unnamed protein product [Paramecium sonneborni]
MEYNQENQNSIHLNNLYKFHQHHYKTEKEMKIIDNIMQHKKCIKWNHQHCNLFKIKLFCSIILIIICLTCIRCIHAQQAEHAVIQYQQDPSEPSLHFRHFQGHIQQTSLTYQQNLHMYNEKKVSLSHAILPLTYCDMFWIHFHKNLIDKDQKQQIPQKFGHFEQILPFLQNRLQYVSYLKKQFHQLQQIHNYFHLNYTLQSIQRMHLKQLKTLSIAINIQCINYQQPAIQLVQIRKSILKYRETSCVIRTCQNYFHKLQVLLFLPNKKHYSRKKINQLQLYHIYRSGHIDNDNLLQKANNTLSCTCTIFQGFRSQFSVQLAPYKQSTHYEDIFYNQRHLNIFCYLHIFLLKNNLKYNLYCIHLMIYKFSICKTSFELNQKITNGIISGQLTRYTIADPPFRHLKSLIKSNQTSCTSTRFRISGRALQLEPFIINPTIHPVEVLASGYLVQDNIHQLELEASRFFHQLLFKQQPIQHDPQYEAYQLEQETLLAFQAYQTCQANLKNDLPSVIQDLNGKKDYFQSLPQMENLVTQDYHCVGLVDLQASQSN